MSHYLTTDFAWLVKNQLYLYPTHCQIRSMYLVYLLTYLQGMVDGSASKPALRQDTGYMVEKTYYDIAPYLGAFGAYLMPQ